MHWVFFLGGDIAGVDERDVEVALAKLGLAHERHYRECPGGPVCNFLVAPTGPAAGGEGKGNSGVQVNGPVHG
jgi:hypothetical protein